MNAETGRVTDRNLIIDRREKAVKPRQGRGQDPMDQRARSVVAFPGSANERNQAL